MSEELTVAPPSEQEVRKMTKQVPNMQTVYCNQARIAAGYFDVQVFFGKATVSATGEPSFTEELCIAMSPEFAKSLVELFVAQLAPYEQLFGKFRAIPDQAAITAQMVARKK
jgi:hypothetical protein